MQTYLLTIAYDGTNFKGWQIQRKHGKIRERTVQSELLKVLKRISGFEGSVVAASRTDSGVHAKAQAVSFSLKRGIPPNDLLQRFNALLPKDIAPRSIKKVPDGFNARFKAKKKEYIYTIYHSPLRPVIARNFVWWRSVRLNINTMRKAARYLLGRHDFKAFQGSNSPREDTFCTIYNIKINKKNEFLRIHIVGNRFLYNMVRNIVGALIEVSRGKIKPAQCKAYLTSSGSKKAGPKAPARGLLLKKVFF